MTSLVDLTRDQQGERPGVVAGRGPGQLWDRLLRVAAPTPRTSPRPSNTPRLAGPGVMRASSATSCLKRLRCSARSRRGAPNHLGRRGPAPRPGEHPGTPGSQERPALQEPRPAAAWRRASVHPPGPPARGGPERRRPGPEVSVTRGCYQRPRSIRHRRTAAAVREPGDRAHRDPAHLPDPRSCPPGAHAARPASPGPCRAAPAQLRPRS